MLPVFINFFALVSSGFWIVYGVLANLPEVIIPNVFMEFICVIAIIFYFIYKRKYHKKYGSDNLVEEDNYKEMNETPGFEFANSKTFEA